MKQHDKDIYPTPSDVQPQATAQPPKSKPRLPMLIAGLIAALLIVGFIVAITDNKPSPQKGKNAAQVLPGGEVTITGDGFSPATIRVKKGQAVTWVNQDSKAAHQVASDPYPSEDALPGLTDDEPLQKGESYTFTFEKSGTFTYHDHLNPLTLKGTVVVE